MLALFLNYPKPSLTFDLSFAVSCYSLADIHYTQILLYIVISLSLALTHRNSTVMQGEMLQKEEIFQFSVLLGGSDLFLVYCCI